MTLEDRPEKLILPPICCKNPLKRRVGHGSLASSPSLDRPPSPPPPSSADMSVNSALFLLEPPPSRA